MTNISRNIFTIRTIKPNYFSFSIMFGFTVEYEQFKFVALYFNLCSYPLLFKMVLRMFCCLIKNTGIGSCLIMYFGWLDISCAYIVLSYVYIYIILYLLYFSCSKKSARFSTDDCQEKT